jgi:hypothetical protein
MRWVAGTLGFWLSCALLAYGGINLQQAQGHPCQTTNVNVCNSSKMCTWMCLSGPGNALACGCTDQTNVIEPQSIVIILIGAFGWLASVYVLLRAFRRCCKRDSESYDTLQETEMEP